MAIQYTIGSVTVNQLHEFGVHARDAMGFLASAIQLDQCRGAGMVEKYEALDANMKLWIGVQTLVTSNKNEMSEALKSNLMKLRDYVIQQTLSLGEEEPPEKLFDLLININLQISEGLLEAGASADV